MAETEVFTQSEGVRLIWLERRRQVEQEGYSRNHDAEHDQGAALLVASFCYLGDLINGPHTEPSSLWPWEGHAWKPTPDDPVRQLVKAGALIAAEIDRRTHLKAGK